ncbi:MAG: hypothetical protein K1X66_08400 [Verrucomicrobiae bacterium]|nr:hypothetical protein [Verrucomicrobiae bacterium]
MAEFSTGETCVDAETGLEEATREEAGRLTSLRLTESAEFCLLGADTEGFTIGFETGLGTGAIDGFSGFGASAFTGKGTGEATPAFPLTKAPCGNS